MISLRSRGSLTRNAEFSTRRIEAVKRRDAGETLAAIAKSYAVDISMISRL